MLDGTLHCVCSDHSPCALEEEQGGKNGFFDVWGGLSGIQMTAQVFLVRLYISGNKARLIVCAMAQRPAQIFGLDHRKGSLAVGMDADLTPINPERRPWEITEASLHYLNPISAFIGCKGHGCPVLTLLRGGVVARDGVPVSGARKFSMRIFPEILKKIALYPFHMCYLQRTSCVIKTAPHLLCSFPAGKWGAVFYQSRRSVSSLGMVGVPCP